MRTRYMPDAKSRISTVSSSSVGIVHQNKIQECFTFPAGGNDINRELKACFHISDQQAEESNPLCQKIFIQCEGDIEKGIFTGFCHSI